MSNNLESNAPGELLCVNSEGSSADMVGTLAVFASYR